MRLQSYFWYKDRNNFSLMCFGCGQNIKLQQKKLKNVWKYI
jgi:hypothetical protein